MNYLNVVWIIGRCKHNHSVGSRVSLFRFCICECIHLIKFLCSSVVGWIWSVLPISSDPQLLDPSLRLQSLDHSDLINGFIHRRVRNLIALRGGWNFWGWSLMKEAGHFLGAVTSPGSLSPSLSAYWLPWGDALSCHVLPTRMLCLS